MATMKTLSSVCGLGIKCLQTRCGNDFLYRTVPTVYTSCVRHGRYMSSPYIDENTKYAEYEVSRSPEEWKYVQDLLPKPVISKPKPKAEYPSGWRPQNPPANSPYFIQRTANHMLPVYMVRSGPRGQNVVTKVRYVQGDVWALDSEITAMLKRVYPSEQFKIKTQVNEVAGMLVIRGDYASAVSEYLKSKGW